MINYLIAIFISIGVISTGNIILLPAGYGIAPALIVLWVFAGAVIVFAIDAITALTIRNLPRRLYSPYNAVYKVHKREERLYESLGIRKWKDRIPEMGKLINFRKDKLTSTSDSQYLYKFLEETCYAEAMHFWSAFTGYLLILIYPLEYVFIFSLPIATVNLALQILPIMVQRYLRPKLLWLYERSTAK